MSTLAILAPLVGIGIGMAAAYGVTHADLDRRIHFVRRENIQEELNEFEVNLENGETCGECGDDVDPEEIGTVYLEGDQYKIVCNKQVCLDTYDIN